MKKTCDRCKALHEGQGESFSCELGYAMNVEKGIPQEECPKPLTYSDLIKTPKKGRK